MRIRAILLTLATLALAVGACDETVPSDQTSSSEATGSSSVSSSSSGAGGGGGAGGGAPDCTMNPMTHVEIINACTNADWVDKMPVLPLLGQDGKLPPLP